MAVVGRIQQYVQLSCEPLTFATLESTTEVETELIDAYMYHCVEILALRPSKSAPLSFCLDGFHVTLIWMHMERFASSNL